MIFAVGGAINIKYQESVNNYAEKRRSRVRNSTMGKLAIENKSLPHSHFIKVNPPRPSAHSIPEISSDRVYDEQAITFTHYWMYWVSVWISV